MEARQVASEFKKLFGSFFPSLKVLHQKKVILVLGQGDLQDKENPVIPKTAFNLDEFYGGPDNLKDVVELLTKAVIASAKGIITIISSWPYS